VLEIRGFQVAAYCHAVEGYYILTLRPLEVDEEAEFPMQ
jgi:hypothetical protein